MNELDLAAADAAASEAGRPAAGKPGAHALPDNCANCGTVLKGRWCHACGQGADDHRRSLRPLIKEGLEGLFHLDGRLLRTLPQLFLRPGRLVGDFFAGRVTRHVPPFRLFLAALFVYFLAAEGLVDQLKKGGEGDAAAISVTKSTVAGQGETFNASPLRATPKERRIIAARVRATDPGEQVSWTQERMARGIENMDVFVSEIMSWAQRLAILLLPIQAAMLALLYANQKRWFFYDHLVFSMTHLSFCFLAFAIAFVVPSVLQSLAFSLALLLTPVNLYLALRGGYGSRRLAAAARTAVVSVATVASFSLLVTGLVLLSLNEV